MAPTDPKPATDLFGMPEQRPEGWQRHPSTHSAHFFRVGSMQSLCKRATRTTGAVEAAPGPLPCSLCQNRLR